MGRLFHPSVLTYFLFLFKGSYGNVPASNAVQTSILNQQAYNLCLHENSIRSQKSSCTSFGTPGMIPSQTVLTISNSKVTFVASFLLEYGGLPSAGTTITTTGADGGQMTVPIGELGQAHAHGSTPTARDNQERNYLPWAADVDINQDEQFDLIA
ncbi:uncharacterized protein BDR25DRAFT_314755 [Lindgomyces ingoldianus]|uniref:Uncharacterized protein n=1 Tax=Lindgomyces ingoldianus TaxID=673940 RepID=A0ACB6QV77_9PLEO|nr:uncharacterized protein BDR25DRAFT_314755 [Lindgomyces ingoldianus]KAF2469985.1 hypothetical protein BDR25DRAFT_314755 [Lindgomyces ingoldianus]